MIKKGIIPLLMVFLWLGSLLVMVLAAVSFGVLQWGPGVRYLEEAVKAPFSQEKLPEATGDVDDVVDSLLKDALGEETYLEEEMDVELLLEDQLEIDDFGLSVDENEL